MHPLQFLPEAAAAAVPNVVVDGSPNAGTVLTLSHWPGSPTPPEVRDDLSAQIAFRALAHPDWFDPIEAVTNNHFDQDGAASAYALLEPEAALARRAAVVDVARAGDFGVARTRDAARIAMAIAALDDPARSPLAAELAGRPYPEQCGALYEWVLPRFTDLLDHADRWRHLWADEDAHYGESCAAITDGTIVVDERPGIDLAVVTVPEAWAERIAHRFTRSSAEAVHPMAVNTATERLRVLQVQGRRFRLELRYETWVMLVSRQVLPRPDLRLLAAELDALEPAGVRWRADAPGALTPHLAPVGGESDLSPAQVVATTERFLATAAPAWDPFAPR